MNVTERADQRLAIRKHLRDYQRGLDLLVYTPQELEERLRASAASSRMCFPKASSFMTANEELASIVYRLYGLTAEEIDLVEEASP